MGVIRGYARTTGLTAGIAAALVVGVTGCGSGGGDVKPQSADHRATTGKPSAPSGMDGHTSAPPTPTTAADALTLPASCENLLTMAELEQITGRRIGGEIEYIKGVPEPSIARTGRVDCRYGVTPRPTGQPSDSATTTPSDSTATPSAPRPSQSAQPAQPAAVEIGVSEYSDHESASQRIDFTVRQQQAAGAKPSDISISGHPAILLTNKTESILVLAEDKFTLVLSTRSTVASAQKLPEIVSRIAEGVLRRMG